MSNQPNSGRLFFLDLGAGRLLSVNPDGSDLKTILTEGHGPHPDGVAVDVATGRIYWTNMGDPGANDGSIERCALDGTHRTVIVAPGATHTPKQLQFDRRNGRLYWSDREGMRVMRCNLDGSAIQTLVETGHGDADRRDQRNWCVGVAVDLDGGKVYWTQKGPDKAGSFAPTWKFPQVNRQRAAPTSNSSTMGCRSPSIWSSISPIGCSTGPTAATRRAAIP